MGTFHIAAMWQQRFGVTVTLSGRYLVSAYEARIERTERDKIVLAESTTSTVPPKGRLEDCIELAMRFPSSP
jgi:hypothetical protein